MPYRRRCKHLADFRILSEKKRVKVHADVDWLGHGDQKLPAHLDLGNVRVCLPLAERDGAFAPALDLSLAAAFRRARFGFAA
jgi:hypothetical protein